MTITIYTRPDCPYCELARKALDAAGDAYVEVDVTHASEAYAEVRRLTGDQYVLPVLVEDDGEARVGFGRA